MRAQTRERLANEAATWGHLGLIDDALAQTLAQRYDARGSAGFSVLKWLGLFGVFSVAAALLGFIGALAGEAGLLPSAVLLAVAAVVAWYAGAWLAVDPAQRHPVLGSALLTVGLAVGSGALAVLCMAVGLEHAQGLAMGLLMVTAIAALATAYRFCLRWPLLLGVLCFFHAVGSAHAYAGNGAYVAGIEDKPLMAVTALGVIALGVWHESVLEAGALSRQVGFGSLYLVFGLLYFNLALWFQSLEAGLAWVLAFTAGGIGQIVAGAALKDSRFTGFGIVFLGIDLYTRFFEHFWDRLSVGAFFAIAGLLGMGLGALCEWVAQQRRLPL